MTLVTLEIRSKLRSTKSFVKVLLKMTLCQFGQNMAIGSKDKSTELYDPDCLENLVKVITI